MDFTVIQNHPVEAAAAFRPPGWPDSRLEKPLDGLPVALIV
jgi:hypothetical protein